MTARTVAVLAIVPEPEDVAPSGPVRWPPTWAADVARDARRLRASGVPAESAWWQAAALHRPAGVPDPRRPATSPASLPAPDPELRTGDRALAILRAASAPLTTREVATALGLGLAQTLAHLHRVGVVAGERPATKERGALLWALSSEARTSDGPSSDALRRIVAHLSTQAEPSTLPEIAAATGVPRSTALGHLRRIGVAVGHRAVRAGGQPSLLWRAP